MTDRQRAERIIKELPGEEFIKLVESSSAEELHDLLQALDSQPQKARRTGGFLKALVSVPTKQRSAFEIIGWWEARRLIYNIAVGLAGLVTLLALFLCDRASLLSLVGGVFVYAIGANICYTLGWMAELLARQLFQEKAENIGPMLFALGLVFSVFLTLLPIAAIVLIVVLARV